MARSPNFDFFTTYRFTVIILFGVVFALLTPPFQSPDEPNHFLRSWQVSEGHFFPENTGTRLGGTLPASLSQVCDSFLFLKNNPNAWLNLRTWRNALAIPLRPENRHFTDFANTAFYAPTAYLPQAAAIVLLRPLGATPLQLLYAARLANLLAWALFVSAALRLMPFLRPAIAAIAMLPATLCMAASASADVLTNGLCWWLVAALLAAPMATVFWKKLIVGIMIAMNKLIAVPLVLLGRVSKNQGRELILLFGAVVLAAIFWGQLAQTWFVSYDAYDPAFRDTQTLNSGVDPARQVAFVAKNPGFFIKICAQSLFQAAPSMAAHVVGKFGWEKNYLPTMWLISLWVMLMALIFSEKNPLTLRQRLGMGGVVALYVAAFAFTIYALWVAVGAGRIDNWQGRYFLPIAPVAVLAAGQGWWEKRKGEIEFFAFMVLVGSNLAMAFEIWCRYW